MLKDEDLPMFRHWSVITALGRVRQLSILNPKDVEYRYTLGEVHTWMRVLAKLYDKPMDEIAQLFSDATAELAFDASAEYVLHHLRDSWRPDYMSNGLMR